MKQLKELLEVVEKTDTMLLLKVKPNSQLDLIKNEFDGNETLFRLSFDKINNYVSQCYFKTFYGPEYKPGSTYTWGKSMTCASDEWTKQKNKIVTIAEKYFDFKMR